LVLTTWKHRRPDHRANWRCDPSWLHLVGFRQSAALSATTHPGARLNQKGPNGLPCFSRPERPATDPNGSVARTAPAGYQTHGPGPSVWPVKRFRQQGPRRDTLFQRYSLAVSARQRLSQVIEDIEQHLRRAAHRRDGRSAHSIVRLRNGTQKNPLGERTVPWPTRGSAHGWQVPCVVGLLAREL